MCLFILRSSFSSFFCILSAKILTLIGKKCYIQSFLVAYIFTSNNNDGMIQVNRISLILSMNSTWRTNLRERAISLVKSMTPYIIQITYDINELKLLPVRIFRPRLGNQAKLNTSRCFKFVISRRETGHQAMWPSCFEVFLILLNFRRS